MKTKNKPYVSFTAAAQILGISRQLFRQWIDAGLIKPSYTTLKGFARYLKADIEALKKQ